MGNILKAIWEDSELHLQLCAFYNEVSEGGAYGKQYYRLKERWQKDGYPLLPDIDK